MLALLALVGPAGVRASETGSAPALDHVRANGRTIPLFEKFELTFAAPCWKVRLAPTTTGTYRCRLRLQSQGKVVEADAGSFAATGNSNRPGCVRISRVNPRYLGELVLHVPRLEGPQRPILQVTIDGKNVFEQTLAREHENDTWDYFGQFRFPLAAGSHRVSVGNLQPATAENFWRDRVTVAYELTNYRRRHGPDLDVAGLLSDACLLVWLRNPKATWLFARIDRKIETQAEGLLRLRNVPDGSYAVIWRDTWTGDVLGRDTAESQGGAIALRTPVVARSAVAKLTKIGL